MLKGLILVALIHFVELGLVPSLARLHVDFPHPFPALTPEALAGDVMPPTSFANAIAKCFLPTDQQHEPADHDHKLQSDRCQCVHATDVCPLG